MADISKSLFKKYRIAIVSVLAFAVAFCCILAFAGNENGLEAFSSTAPEASSPSFGTSSEQEGTYGYGLYIDGVFVAAVSEESTATDALQQILDIRVMNLGVYKNTENSFNNTIELVSGRYSEESFCTSEQLLKLLGKKDSYTVSATVNDYSGNALSIRLSVRSVKTYTETVTLEYETKTVYTDSMRDGVKKVVSKGYNGEGEETYQIVLVDGIEYSRETVSLNVTVAPADEVVRIGTSSNGIDVASLGTFVKPYDGVVTSYMGPRWGRTHNGIDIAGDRCNGKPAYAAADGVVIRADWYGGYGNCVIIDHGNGVQTLYAHFSSLSVSVGDVVTAGQEVGKIGSTGNSTGPHLHFEVFLDGELVNPLIFVDYED